MKSFEKGGENFVVEIAHFLNNFDTKIVHTSKIEPISNLEDDFKNFCGIVDTTVKF